MINKFIKKFTNKEFKGIEKIRREYYLLDNNLHKFIDNMNMLPESAGLFLGHEKKKEFFPSLPLIDILAKHSNRKMIINGRAEWLFLCGRDIMAHSIIDSNKNKGLILIQNEKDENLGIGRIIGNLNLEKNNIVVKNILDKGDFLRREIKK